MMKYDVGVGCYAFVIGCLVSALLWWCTGSFAAEIDYDKVPNGKTYKLLNEEYDRTEMSDE